LIVARLVRPDPNHCPPPCLPDGEAPCDDRDNGDTDLRQTTEAGWRRRAHADGRGGLPTAIGFASNLRSSRFGWSSRSFHHRRGTLVPGAVDFREPAPWRDGDHGYDEPMLSPSVLSKRTGCTRYELVCRVGPTLRRPPRPPGEPYRRRRRSAI
jgi:hypothetical protein